MAADADSLFQQGAAYEKQNYVKTRQHFQTAAKQGNASALTRLGIMYEEGRGVAKNQKRARQYYEQATKQQNAEALYRLGELYVPDHENLDMAASKKP